MTGSSSDSNVVSVNGNGSKAITISAGKTSGTATITCTFTPASGKTYNGNKKLTFSVNNTIYPTNSDGSYTLSRTITKTSEGYDYQDYVGGITRNHGAFPDGATIKLNAEEFPYCIYNESTHNKVLHAVDYISQYSYPKPCYYHEAVQLVLYGCGDCWAGNSLLYAICDEMGLNPLYRYAGLDGGGNGEGHVHVIIKINGTDYVADATPGYTGQLVTWTEYCKKHPYATKNW